MRQFVDGLYGGENSRKRFIGRLVHHFLTAVHYVEMEEFASPLLRWRVGMAPGQKAFLDVLKDLVVREVITSPAVQHLEFKGQTMVVAVFEAMQADPRRLLPRDRLPAYEQYGVRAICDYVASMTDTSLLKTYERLFAPAWDRFSIGCNGGRPGRQAKKWPARRLAFGKFGRGCLKGTSLMRITGLVRKCKMKAFDANNATSDYVNAKNRVFGRFCAMAYGTKDQFA
jgi:hypothetical protein